MAGTLTIHSSGTGDLTSGHSWIEYTPDGASTSTTYGTWGNDPGGLGNGLHQDLELGRPSDVSRSIHIDDAGESRLYETIGEYQGEGEDAWGYTNPCSGFASDAWNNATGEDLGDRNMIGLSNPSTLKDSINEANAPPDPDAGSSSETGSSSDDAMDPTMTCPKPSSDDDSSL